MLIAKLIYEFLRLIFRSKLNIVLEDLALRQQWGVQKRSTKRPKIKNCDRIFWIWLSRFPNDWQTFTCDETTQHFIRDNDKIFSDDFKTHIKNILQSIQATSPSSWISPASAESLDRFCFIQKWAGNRGTLQRSNPSNRLMRRYNWTRFVATGFEFIIRKRALVL